MKDHKDNSEDAGCVKQHKDNSDDAGKNNFEEEDLGVNDCQTNMKGSTLGDYQNTRSLEAMACGCRS